MFTKTFWHFKIRLCMDKTCKFLLQHYDNCNFNLTYDMTMTTIITMNWILFVFWFPSVLEDSILWGLVFLKDLKTQFQKIDYAIRPTPWFKILALVIEQFSVIICLSKNSIFIVLMVFFWIFFDLIRTFLMKIRAHANENID